MPLKQPALAGMPFSEPGRWEYFLSHVQRGHSHPEKRRIMVATVAAIGLLVWTRLAARRVHALNAPALASQ
tara:strand:+ start:569 stop:781 length:213 start_codon:yes stop_codon:yes gene_type:complete